MKLRGWRNDDWGKLLEDDGSLGSDPICVLEAIHGYADAPGDLAFESPEQFYVRSAFPALGWDAPLYISEWNDEQETFEPVETLLNKAIELAEADERAGRKPYDGETPNKELRQLFRIDPDLMEARRRQDAAEREGASEAAQ